MGSSVWDHFIKENDTAMCKYCDKKYKMKSGSTSTLNRHYENTHQLAAPGPSTSAQQPKQRTMRNYTTPSKR